MTIQCPHCNVSLDGEANPGDEIECPSCGKAFVLPNPREQSKQIAKRIVRVPSSRNPIHNSPRAALSSRRSSYSQPKQQKTKGVIPLIIILGIICIVLIGVAIIKYDEKQREAARVAELGRNLNRISESAHRTTMELYDIEERHLQEYGSYDELKELRAERRHEELMWELKKSREKAR